MDFSSLMAKAISDAKPSQSCLESTKKYFKRGEIEIQRQVKYFEEQKAIETEREAKLSQKRKLEEREAELKQRKKEKQRRLAEESSLQKQEKEAEEERARRKRLGLPERVHNENDQADTDDIQDSELFEKLRALGEPIKLFGESHKQRLRRFRKLGTIMTNGIIPTSLQLVEEKDMKVDRLPKDKEGREYLFRQLASYFTMVMTEWESALQKEKKDTFASKAAHNAMIQSRESMIPVSFSV